MRQRLEKLLPLYGILPLVSLFSFNLLVYEGVRLINVGRHHYDLTIPFLDGKIPFVPAFIYIYILSYVFWGIGYVVIARESREVCFRVCAGDLIAKAICLVIFLCMPTTIGDWPSGSFPINSLSDWLTQFIYNADAPDNLFPSIHCLESWMVFRGALSCKKMNNGYRIFCLLFALSVFASVVFVKQHVCIDILGGVAAVEIGLFLAKKLHADRIFYALDARIQRKDGCLT